MIQMATDIVVANNFLHFNEYIFDAVMRGIYSLNQTVPNQVLPIFLDPGLLATFLINPIFVPAP